MGKFRLSVLVLFFLSLFVSAAYEDVSLTYDANGNIIQDADYYYEYNGFNNLVRVREADSEGRVVAEYVYGPVGNRVKKSVNKSDGWEYTYYVGDVVRVVNSSGTYDTVYVHDDQGTLLSRQDDDGKKYYYHPDHLGSTRIITNQTGDVVEEIEYLPFGADLTNSSQKFTFTGQESDLESDLLYYGARYHSPYLRQFTQPDTVIPNIYAPQNLNRYTYTLNNPLKYTDPTGNSWSTVYDIGKYIVVTEAGLTIGLVVTGGVFVYRMAEDAYEDTTWYKNKHKLKTQTKNQQGSGSGEDDEGKKHAPDPSKPGSDPGDQSQGTNSQTDVSSTGSDVWDSLEDGSSMSRPGLEKSRDSFLGEGYKQAGENRYVSADGTRQVRVDEGQYSHGKQDHWVFERITGEKRYPKKHITVED